jgi:hypothetical protein
MSSRHRELATNDILDAQSSNKTRRGRSVVPESQLTLCNGHQLRQRGFSLLLSSIDTFVSLTETWDTFNMKVVAIALVFYVFASPVAAQYARHAFHATEHSHILQSANCKQLFVHKKIFYTGFSAKKSRRLSKYRAASFRYQYSERTGK